MTEFEKWCEPIINQINVPVTIYYGHIGTGYSQLLIVEGEQIKSIGEFVYNLYYYNKVWDNQLKIQLGIEAEKYRIGQRLTVPSLCYYYDTLTVR